MATNDLLIEVRDLWKVFGNNPQKIAEDPELRDMSKGEIRQRTGYVVGLKGISFQVRAGEFFVIMGLSGSGKSTLVRSLIRLIDPTAGKLIIDGEDILEYDDKRLIQFRRDKVAMVFQHFALLPHRRVIDNVAYGLEVQGVDKRARYLKAEEVLETVGLKGWEQSYPTELSGGMQQRVGLARGLAVDPDILLMDEPFSGLDPLIRREMQDELINLQQKLHKTIVFITHDLNESLKLGEQIAILKDGEIVQQGTPEEIVMSPADDYVSQFVQDVSKAKVMGVRSIMQQPEVLLYDWQGPRVAMHMLKSNDISTAFVISRTRVLRGMVDVDEAAEAANKGIPTLGEAVKDECPKVGPDTTVEEMVPLAAENECPIAVVDEEGQLLGEVHRAAVLSGMAGQPTKVPLVRDTCQQLGSHFPDRRNQWNFPKAKQQFPELPIR